MVTHAGLCRRDVQEGAYDRFPRLAERRDQSAGTLSGGEQERPWPGPSPAIRPACWSTRCQWAWPHRSSRSELVGAVADHGVTVLCVEQLVPAVLGVADLAAVMVQGRITTVGRRTDVEADLARAISARSAEGQLSSRTNIRIS